MLGGVWAGRVNAPGYPIRLLCFIFSNLGNHTPSEVILLMKLVLMVHFATG